nr:pilus assembly protein N-terminal domain-containing protein [uncultured Dongia sp.]
MRAIVLATLATLTLGTVGATLGPLVSTAEAADVVSVTWRKAQVMSFGSGVSSIIIGDPSVVDVTLEGSGQVIVFGKVPGETNMMVLGSDGTVLFNASVVVMPEDDRVVSIISPGSDVISERSWTCLTRCVQVLGPGGTPYASVKPGTAGGQIDTMIEKNNAAADAMTEAAKGVSESNSATAKGASDVGGQAGGVIVPY